MKVDLTKSFEKNLENVGLTEKKVEASLSHIVIPVKRGGGPSDKDAKVIGKAAIIAAVGRAAKATVYTGAAAGVLLATHKVFSNELCGHLTTAALNAIPSGIMGSIASPFAKQCSSALANYEFAIKVAMVPVTALLTKAGAEITQLVIPKSVLDDVVSKLMERFKSMPAPAAPVAAPVAAHVDPARSRASSASSSSSSSSSSSDDSAIMGQYDPDSRHYNPNAGRRTRRRSNKKRTLKNKRK